MCSGKEAMMPVRSGAEHDVGLRHGLLSRPVRRSVLLSLCLVLVAERLRCTFCESVSVHLAQRRRHVTHNVDIKQLNWEL